MKARLFLPLVAAMGLGVCTLPAQTPRGTAPALVPAKYHKVTDSLGFIWDVNSSGGITRGSNCFSSGSFSLVIDGDGVSLQSGMMSADGLEYIFTANPEGLQLTRRVRVDPKGSYCRFIETLSNTSGDPRNLDFAIRARLNGRMQVNGSDSGDHPVPYREKEPGVIIVGAGKTSAQPQPQPSFVWMLTAGAKKIRPTVQIEQSTYLTAHYPVTLPPGASVSLVHAVAQRSLTEKPDAKKNAELFAPMTSSRFLADVPARERKDFANFTPMQTDGGGDAAGALTALLALLETAQVGREKTDTVLLDAGAKVSGTVSGGALAIETDFGKADVPFADIAAIAGGGGVQRPVRIFLRDGEIMTGAVSRGGFTMTTDSGLRFDIDLSQIQLLALRKGGEDGRPPEGAAALLTMQRGDCLALAQKSAAELQAATPWGMLRVPLVEIESVEYAREPFPGHRLTLADRSRLPVMLRGDEWAIATTRFGTVKIAPQSVRELRKAAAKATAPANAGAEGEADFANCELSGENRLAGVIDLPELHLASAKSTTTLDPKTITTLTREAGEDGDALVKITLADGQELSGRLVESTLPIRSAGRVWRVPAAHILSVNVPPPAKSKDETPSAPSAPATPAKPRALTEEIINAPPDIPPIRKP